jgi:hypothetical protein
VEHVELPDLVAVLRFEGGASKARVDKPRRLRKRYKVEAESGGAC